MSSETENTDHAEGPETAGNLPVPVPEGALTIPEKRLVGSIECMNCGTELQGPFCHYCGQPDKNFMRFFPVLMRELLSDFLDFDSRFSRTIKPLLFKPGKLTRDYLDGRRFRYVPPLRLYIFSSLAFFFLAAVLAGDAIHIGEGKAELNVDETGIRFEIDDDDEQDLDEALDALDSIDPGLADQVNDAITEAQQEAASKAEDHDHEDDVINLNGEPWDRETNPFIIGWLPDWVNDRVNDEIEQSPQKGKEIEANPDLIKEKVFDVLPGTMFVLLPIVALLFKFWYLFAKRYYIEHLIFALHNHAFIFVVATIMLLLSTFAGWREPAEDGQLTTVIGWINIVIAIWIPVYLLISLKRVYQQGWGMTAAKFTLVGISYMVLLGFATVFVALLSFVLL